MKYGSPVHLRLRSLIEEGVALGCTDVVTMEILAGAHDEGDRDRLRRLLHRLEFLPAEGPADYESAAELYRQCRRGRPGPRKLTASVERTRY